MLTTLKVFTNPLRNVNKFYYRFILAINKGSINDNKELIETRALSLINHYLIMKNIQLSHIFSGELMREIDYKSDEESCHISFTENKVNITRLKQNNNILLTTSMSPKMLKILKTNFDLEFSKQQEKKKLEINSQIKTIFK